MGHIKNNKMNKEEILNQFKIKNPDLIKLNAKINIGEIIERYSSATGKTTIYNPPKLDITIKHPFIFDNRLIPKSFNGIEVRNVTVGSYPKEFPSENCGGMTYEEMYAPENYEDFVDKNLNLINKKLKKSNLTKADILDALTGNFSKHKQYCKKSRNERLDNSKNEKEFFNKLLEETKQAYNQSQIKKLQKNNEWGYSVTATMIMKNQPLVVGFNWGVDAKWVELGNKYGAQTKYPFRVFESNYDEMGSLKRTINYFHEYYPEALNGMQTNYCFFRSEKEGQITDHDIKLSSKLFKKYLDYSTPSIIISFSNRLREHFETAGKLKDIITPKEKIKSNSKIISPIVAKLEYIEGKLVDFVYLPHPNYPVTKVARDKTWKFCFEKINKNAT